MRTPPPHVRGGEGCRPITAILHGAARSVPCLIENLAGGILRNVSAKIRGAQNLLAAIDPDHLRLFITFSSIIARIAGRSLRSR